MNSYNENLNSSVSSSLNNQEVALKKAESQLDATLFSLYYAQGDYITIYEDLEVENSKNTFNQKLFNDMVVDSDISTNVLSSVNQGKTLVATSTSNASVAASDVQLATNAIVKLASDIGSIFNIVSAADYGSELYQQSEDAQILMGETAYLAEVLSQITMDTSAAISEVSAEELATKAEASDTMVKKLLAVTKSEFEKSANQVNTENDNLAKASTNEKKLEGELEDSKVNFDASKEAYKLTNDKLNLDLTVKPKNKKNLQYKVSFTPYKSPFQISEDNLPSGYPVDSYNIFLVKESKKKTFSISGAEGIVSKEENKNYINIKIKGRSTNTDSFTVGENQISGTIKYDDLNDTDGDVLQIGNDYVVFVMAVLSTEYKKLINNFEDYLSAPTASFSLTNQLVVPQINQIKITNLSSKKLELSLADKIVHGDSISDVDFTGAKPSNNISVEQQLEFDIKQSSNFQLNEGTKNVETEYRCMFLPDNSEFIKGLLTSQELNYLATSVEDDGSIALELSELKLREVNLTANLEKLEKAHDNDPDVKKWFVSVQKSVSSKTLETLVETKTLAEGGEANLSTVLKKLTVKNISAKLSATILLESIILSIDLSLVQKSITTEEKEQSKNVKESENNKFKPGFMFNSLVAAKIPAGCYSNPVKKEDAYTVAITADVTDNFGNRLIPGDLYIPVVFAINSQAEEISKQFNNALSDFQQTPPFTYKNQTIPNQNK
ncbi:hypothetical protein SAMN04489761_0256 [Tenacibaculum sp. MAR_2009_124]|uniref:hypothetical protein n=1 Tax=Tenacibaculum sp. MAR_2009_124 TaxID=1250059 RepID=UPI0008942AD8|nr:hypothetical protein [Tenacibaculum sp. MAR_2009_124]SEB37464.1 hypothetical protein SAMN04489761_0256 [Tenacibaculum sp. MAR_2009_124]